MEFSNSTIYSMIADNGDEHSLEVVKSVVEELNSVKTVNEAKEFLKDVFDIINCTVQNFSICGEGFMNVVENSAILIINVMYSDRNFTYSYLK